MTVPGIVTHMHTVRRIIIRNPDVPFEPSAGWLVEDPYTVRLERVIWALESRVELAWQDGRIRRAIHYAQRLLRLQIALEHAKATRPKRWAHGPLERPATFRDIDGGLRLLMSEAVKRVQREYQRQYFGRFNDDGPNVPASS